jgi:RNA polymerase sigma-70 factor (ECF subfamily)
MASTIPDISELYDRHGDDLLVFLVRRTADPELALDLWAETFAQAVVGLGRYRGSAVAALSTDLRDAIALRVLDERPYPDVAHRLGISEQAARTRVSRGLRQLADALDPADLKEALQS